MPTQKIIWTVLPKGHGAGGELVVSLVPSFRLTPKAPAEQVLVAFPDVLDWPDLIASSRFRLRVGAEVFVLKPVPDPDPALWRRVFPGELPVAGYVYNDLSRHNLRSFPVRTLVSYLHSHYGALAEHDGLERPSLFGPGSRLQGMLGEIGIGHSRRGGIGRWFSDGRTKEGGSTQLESGLNEDYFSDEGYAPPTVTGIDGLPRDNASSFISERKLRRALPAQLSGAVASYFSGEPEYALYQANRFYQRPENARPYERLPVAGAASPPIKAPEFDFHRLASSFADAPSLMRQLGLVIDAVVVGGRKLIDEAQSQPEKVLKGTMRLEIKHDASLQVSTEESTPATAFRLASRRFTCDTRTPRNRAGLLRLTGARPIGSQAQGHDHGFALTGVDPDGAALKTIGFALSLQGHLSKVSNPLDPDTLGKPGELTYTTSQGETVAALRSGGITLVEHGRAGYVADDTIASSLKNDAVDSHLGDKIVFYAEDVLRGYRVDVFTEKSGVWNSLCQRVAKYGWADGSGPAIDPAKDEGYVSGASTTTKPPEELPPGATQDHYLHEALVKWTGWSLIAARPGRRIRPYPDSSTSSAERAKLGLIQEERVDEQSAADTHADGTPVTRDVSAAPGSLPRLRFGQAYRLRARLVDLAGNSLAVDDRSLDKLEQASEPIAYLRYEPLDAPVLSLRQRVSEGESLERMVIRSNHDQTTLEYLGEPAYAGNVPTDSGFAYATRSERHVVPPKTSQLMAEQHGAFEEAFGPGATPAQIGDTYKLISSLEAGTLYDGGADVHIVTPPKDDAVPKSPERALATAPPEGFRLLPGEYLIHIEASLVTPYLPDPLVAAVALRGVPGVYADHPVIDATDNVRAVRIPGTEEHVVIVPLAGTWPRVQGFRLVIEEHPDEAGFDGCTPGADLPVRRPTWKGGTQRILTIYLRKGELAHLRYASALNPHFIDHLAIPQLAATPVKVAIQSVLGVHWMVTPDRPLVLVHATQQPVCAPVFERLNVFRNAGQTWSELRRTMVRYHARSTAKLEVLAEWFEWVDDLAQPAPVRRRFSAQLPEVGIASPPLRSQEPFSDVLFEDLGSGSPEAAHSHLRHEFGDHKFRLVRYNLRASTRFREYLPPSITADSSKLVRVGPVYEGHSLALPPSYDNQYPDPDAVSTPPPTDAELGAPLLPDSLPPRIGSIVPGSRRPDSPKIAYVVPTFRWDEPASSKDAGIVSIRRGNGLRVYLERPWFSSGEGELLGVVVGSSRPIEQPFRDLPDEFIGFVSQWGQDPILASALPRDVMHADAFAARVANHTFELPEAKRSMEVAAHRVHYDFERRLWYADLEIDAGPSYNPFIRLALVRVQPHSVGGCALSEVVHTQYAQLLPTRELHLAGGPHDAFSLQVFGSAPELGPASGRGELTGRLDVLPAWSDALSPLLGYDRGRNRIEMVVQQNSSSLDTDLDWVDVHDIPLLSGEAQPGQTAPLASVHRELVEQGSASAMASSAGSALLSTRIQPEIFEAGLHNLYLLRNDLLFSGRMIVPPTPEGQRRRLMVREHERHFGDFNVTDSTPFGQVPRPGVTERLVFAREFYLLGYAPGEDANREAPFP